MNRKERNIAISICLICIVVSIWAAVKSEKAWAPIGFGLLGIAHSGLACKLILQEPRSCDK